jgi:dTDP-4-dehydrorhamnose 3,5-epimerase
MPALPLGVDVHDLVDHEDERGSFTEVFRREWPTAIDPVQWNYVRSEAGALRGVHVHPRHSDYLLIVEGKAVVGVRDLRQASPTFGLAATVELSAAPLKAIEFPPGVAHGFYFPVASVHLYAVSHYWDTDDELACRWDDAALGIEWPGEPTLISDRDRSAQGLAELMLELEPHQARFTSHLAAAE